MANLESHTKTHYWQNRDTPEYNPTTIKSEHLNNFGLRLPGSSHRAKLEIYTETLREIVGDESGYSPLALSQTPRQFFEAIDKAVEEADVPDPIRVSLCNYQVIDPRQMTEGQKELEKYIYSIYEILRRQGYYQCELTR